MIALEVQNLVKRYGDFTAVKNISFNVEKGEVFGILGPNGAGKTTTIESMAGLKKYEEGSIEILGENLEDYDEDLYYLIGVQLQETAYQDHIKVYEICELFASFYEDPMDYHILLERFQLDEKLKSQVTKLSGGQRQKLSITLSLIGNPEIVFLDELTTGLDPEARRDMWAYIKNLKAEGRTVVMSTHYMEEAAVLCDRICIIKDGELIAYDTVDAVIKQSKLPIEISFDITSEWHVFELSNALGDTEAEVDGNHIKVLTDDESLLTDIILYLHKKECTYEKMTIKRPTLDEAYLFLIGGENHE